ncbi:MAG: single-strand DNA-binding protein [Parcubacteria group bacterium Greene0714_21]|nr:MAG: single-strand DNA-binding protein [Parcubacteria group bacterium Greene0416_39]TSC97884.1 MAG: single-strand DNA-binding protein [Parcubacteria group bacterium Greene1014_47]TSD03915.1 MAG: single-strand DNA-binding protein [Parcubacteria group bacterium Greene0714_21]
MNVNKVFLIGRLTDTPDFRKTASGQSVCSLRIATNRVWTDKTGQKQEEAEYHTVVLWARLADIASQYLNKGNMVFIEGRLKTRSWQDASGIKKYRTEVIAERLQLGPKSQSGGAMGGPAQTRQDVPTATTSPDIRPENSAPRDVGGDGEIPIIEEDEEIDVKDIPF